MIERTMARPMPIRSRLVWDENDALFAKYENRPIGEKRRIAGESVPYGRMGVPEEHTGAAVFWLPTTATTWLLRHATWTAAIG
jgi:hypothetical protein